MILSSRLRPRCGRSQSVNPLAKRFAPGFAPTLRVEHKYSMDVSSWEKSNAAKMKALLVLVVLALSAGSSSAEDYSGRLSCCGILPRKSSNATDGRRQSDELMSTGLDDDYGNQVGKPSGGGGLMTYQQALQKAQKVSAPLCFCRLTPSRSMRETRLAGVRVGLQCEADRYGRGMQGEADQETLAVFRNAYEEVKRGYNDQLITDRKTNLAALLLDVANKEPDPSITQPYVSCSLCLSCVESPKNCMGIIILQKMTVFSPLGLVVCGTRRLKHLCGRHLDCHVQGGNVALGRGSQGVP